MPMIRRGYVVNETDEKIVLEPGERQKMSMVLAGNELSLNAVGEGFHTRDLTDDDG